MPSFGTKHAFFPLRFGGHADRSCKDYYNMIRSERTNILKKTTGESADMDLAIARVMSLLDRNNLRSSKGFQYKHIHNNKRPVVFPDGGGTEDLSPLERWERLLGMTPQASQTEQRRRQAVGARLTKPNFSLEQGCRNILGTWYSSIEYATIDDIDYSGKSPAGESIAYWLDNAFVFDAEYPGSYNASHPWFSGISVVGIWYVAPVGTPDQVIRAKVAEVEDFAENICDAWVFPFALRRSNESEEPGFYLDQSYLDLGGLLWLTNLKHERHG